MGRGGQGDDDNNYELWEGWLRRGVNGWQLRQWGDESDKREMDDDETVGG